MPQVAALTRLCKRDIAITIAALTEGLTIVIEPSWNAIGLCLVLVAALPLINIWRAARFMLWPEAAAVNSIRTRPHRRSSALSFGLLLLHNALRSSHDAFANLRSTTGYFTSTLGAVSCEGRRTRLCNLQPAARDATTQPEAKAQRRFSLGKAVEAVANRRQKRCSCCVAAATCQWLQQH